MGQIGGTGGGGTRATLVHSLTLTQKKQLQFPPRVPLVSPQLLLDLGVDTFGLFRLLAQATSHYGIKSHHRMNSPSDRRGGGRSRAAPRAGRQMNEAERGKSFNTLVLSVVGNTSGFAAGVPRGQGWRSSGQNRLSACEDLTAESAVPRRSSGDGRRWLLSETRRVTCPQTSQVTPDTADEHFMTCRNVWKLVRWELDSAPLVL